MIDELKYNLLPLLGDKECTEFSEGKNRLSFIYSNVKIEGTNSQIIVFYEPNLIGTSQKSAYLNKENTLKAFYDVTRSISYLKYLIFLLSDARHEVHYYFIHKLKELNITHDFSQLTSTGNDQYLRCDISGLSLEGKPLNYNYLLIIGRNNLCRFSFYPEEPLWNEGKTCSENDIVKIMDYIKNMETLNYEDIQIKEAQN